MAQKRYDYFKIMKDANNNELLYARGILTVDVIGLAKTKTGKLVTPTYRIDESGNMQNFFYSKEGEPFPLYSFRDDGKEKVVSQPNMVGKTKQKNLLLWVNNNGTNTWFRLEAWEHIAKRLNMFYRKGQEVVLLAHKVVTKGAESGKQEEVWIINNINKVEKDFVYNKSNSTDTKTNSNDSNTNKGASKSEEKNNQLDGFEAMNTHETNKDFDLPFA